MHNNILKFRKVIKRNRRSIKIGSPIISTLSPTESKNNKVVVGHTHSLGERERGGGGRGGGGGEGGRRGKDGGGGG